jgi:hypothetical protein
MLVCPHCHKELEVRPRPRVVWWQYDPGPSARLGCGTLILIAFIVAAFSSNNSQSVARLEQQVQSLETKIDGLTQSVEKLSPPPQRGTNDRAQ